MSKEAKFWELLGVKPHEQFKLKNTKRGISKHFYHFDNLMNLHVNSLTDKTCIGLYDILSGREEIIKEVNLTDDDKLALEYLKKCGYKWVCKDGKGKIVAFNLRPVKCENQWVVFTSWEGAKTMQVEMDLSFLSWDDECPYEIG